MSVGDGWTFLSNHGHVLLCIAREPDIRLRDVAERVGITERAVQRIVADLEEGGYLTRIRLGRRNQYQVHANLPMRHPIEAHREVRTLIDLVLAPAPAVLPPEPKAKSEPAAARTNSVPSKGKKRS